MSGNSCDAGWLRGSKIEEVEVRTRQRDRIKDERACKCEGDTDRAHGPASGDSRIVNEANPERGAAVAASSCSEHGEREIPLEGRPRWLARLQLRLLQLSSGSTVLSRCNNEQREETRNRVTMPSEIKRNDRRKAVRRG